MTHAAMSPEARATAGISDSLLRVSVGVENADDLCGDLGAALDGVAISEDSSVNMDVASDSQLARNGIVGSEELAIHS